MKRGESLGVAAQVVHAARLDHLAQHDVEVVEGLDVVAEEADGHDQQLVPARGGELAHRLAASGSSHSPPPRPLLCQARRQSPGMIAGRSWATVCWICST